MQSECSSGQLLGLGKLAALDSAKPARSRRTLASPESDFDCVRGERQCLLSNFLRLVETMLFGKADLQ